MSQTPLKLIFVVVVSIAILALIGFGSLCAALFLHVYADAAIVTSIMTTTATLMGYLGGILSNPRQAPPDTKTTQTITQVTQPEPSEPQQVIVANEGSGPVPVQSQP